MTFRGLKLLDFLEVYSGGAERDRTADLLNAIQALSQLSYSPLSGFISTDFVIVCFCFGQCIIFF